MPQSARVGHFRILCLSLLPSLIPARSSPCLDLGAEPALVRELVELLEADVPARLEALQAGPWSEGDAPRVLEEAHHLKGSLGNMGLVQFADLAGARSRRPAGRVGFPRPLPWWRPCREPTGRG